MAFSGKFARRNCAHDAVFHREYQRTNRTKENKILRCFPHCCPDHIARSYCGSSLHLQVDYHAAEHTRHLSSSSLSFAAHAAPLHDHRGFPQPLRDDDLMVFGRFRPKDSRSYRVGDAITGTTILSSLQSEDNPSGEWIEAWLIASADRNSWLYEINHKARWYYNWGSSAAKDKRLKEHVFEAYVLFQPSAMASDSFLVVAATSSPPFTLVSFRRAPIESRNRGHEDNAESSNISAPSSERRASPKRKIPEPRPRRLHEWEEKDSQPAPLATVRPPPSMRHQADDRRPDSHHRQGTHLSVNHTSLDFSSTSSPHKHKRPRAAVAHPYVDHSPPRALFPHAAAAPAPLRHTLHVSRVETHETRTATPTTTPFALVDELLIVFQFLRRLPLASALLLLPSLESSFQQIATTAWPSTHQQRDSRACLNAARHVETLLFELLDARPLPYLRAPFVEAAAHLALWLLLDPTLHQSLERLYDSAATVLLAKASLEESYQHFIRWLHAEIDRQLRARQWSMATFVAAIDRSGLASDADTAQATGVAFSDFVAHARERFITLTVTTTPPKTHARSFMHHGQEEQESSNHSLNGSWRGDIERVHVRLCRSGSGGGAPPDSLSPVPLQTLLWFWRQLSCVVVTLEPTQKTLEIRSAFASREASAMQLILDGRPRWFRSFPGGESTSAVSTGSQRFGDYHATQTDDSGSVECVMYSWPVDGVSDAHCWHWLLQPLQTPRDRTASSALLRVQLVLETGRLMAGEHTTNLDTASLHDKCERVAEWQRTLMADWIMERALPREQRLDWTGAGGK